MAQIIYPLSIGALETGGAIAGGASVGEGLLEGAYAIGSIVGVDALNEGRKKLFKPSEPESEPRGKKMGRTKSKKSKSKKGKKKVPRALTTFPKQQVYKLKSTHLGVLDPGATGAVAYAEVNINRPYNPFESGVTWTLTSSEHEPKYWDLLADTIYSKFTPLETTVTVEFLDSGNTKNHWIFMVPASHQNSADVKSTIADTYTGGVRLRERNPDAIVHFASTTSSAAGHHVLKKTVNIRKLEQIKTEEAGLLQGTTSAGSNTQAAPARSSKLYFGVGSLENTDLGSIGNRS